MATWEPPIRVVSGKASTESVRYSQARCASDGSLRVDLSAQGDTVLLAQDRITLAGATTVNGTLVAADGTVTTPSLHTSGGDLSTSGDIAASVVSTGVLETATLSGLPDLAISAPVTAAAVTLSGGLGGLAGAPLTVRHSPVTLGTGDTGLVFEGGAALRCVNGRWAFSGGDTCVEAVDDLGRPARFTFSPGTDATSGYPSLDLTYSVGDARAVLVHRWLSQPQP